MWRRARLDLATRADRVRDRSRAQALPSTQSNNVKRTQLDPCTNMKYMHMHRLSKIRCVRIVCTLLIDVQGHCHCKEQNL